MADGGTADDVFEIEVAYAKPDSQAVVVLKVPSGVSAEEAVSLSGLLERYPEINQSDLKLGVFGVLCKPEQRLKQGDRVEIYRPLIHDPKQSRRIRADKR